MTTLHITVGDRDDRRQDALQFVRTAERESRKTTADTQVLQFGSYEDLVSSLTPLRLELIQAIAKETPKSIRETARLVDRDVSDVHTDLKQLEVLGVLEFVAGGPGGAMQPVVPFDRIEMQINYPLVDDSEADTSSASV